MKNKIIIWSLLLIFCSSILFSHKVIFFFGLGASPAAGLTAVCLIFLAIYFLLALLVMFHKLSPNFLLIISAPIMAHLLIKFLEYLWFGIYFAFGSEVVMYLLLTMFLYIIFALNLIVNEFKYRQIIFGSLLAILAMLPVAHQFAYQVTLDESIYGDKIKSQIEGP